MADSTAPGRALARPDILDSSRLAVLSALAAATAAVPMPLVPLAIERYLRGAVVFDVASRHGLSLTREAREALASVDKQAPGMPLRRGIAQYALKLLSRRLSPMGVVAPARASVEILALGILFERYVRNVRRGPAVRVHAAEARAVRDVIDRAVARVFAPELKLADAETVRMPPEDLRDDWTRFIDTVLLTGASIPGYVMRRLEAAFDQVIADCPELLDG